MFLLSVFGRKYRSLAQPLKLSTMSESDKRTKVLL